MRLPSASKRLPRQKLLELQESRFERAARFEASRYERVASSGMAASPSLPAL